MFILWLLNRSLSKCIDYKQAMQMPHNSIALYCIVHVWYFLINIPVLFCVKMFFSWNVSFPVSDKKLQTATKANEVSKCKLLRSDPIAEDISHTVKYIYELFFQSVVLICIIAIQTGVPSIAEFAMIPSFISVLDATWILFVLLRTLLGVTELIMFRPLFLNCWIDVNWKM